jgi:outer membrane protein assembly factor BamD
MAEELRLKKEKKGFEIAKQYHTIKDYKASIKSLDNFIADNPGTNFRESALLIQFKSAATLALNSVDYKKLSRLEDSKSKYQNFTRLYPESQYLTEAKKIFDQVVEEIVNFANQK